jgi:hypothetical protein
MITRHPSSTRRAGRVDRGFHRPTRQALTGTEHDFDGTVECTAGVGVVEDELDGVEEVTLEVPLVGSGGKTKSNSTPTLIG